MIKKRVSGQKRSTFTTSLLAAAAAAAVVALAPSAKAATRTWANTGTDFNTAANWGGTVPLPADNATFTGAEVTNPDLSAPLTIQGLTFSSATTSGYTLSSANGSALTLTNVASPYAINATNTTGTNTISANIVLGGAAASTATFRQENTSDTVGGTLIISGNISSTNAISSLTLIPISNRNGSVFTLSGNNSYVGNTTIGWVTLNINSSTALGSSATGVLQTNNNGKFDNTSGNDAESLVQGITGGTNGTLTFVGTNSMTFGGLVTINNGITANNGTNSKTLTLNGAASVTAGGKVLTVNNSGSLVFGSTVNWGAFQTQKSGNGKLVLSSAGSGAGVATAIGSVTYTTDLRINAGTVELGNSVALGTGVVDIRGATLQGNTDLSGANKIANTFVIASGSPTIGGTSNIELGGSLIQSNGASTTTTLTISNTAATTISGSVYMTDHPTAVDNQTLLVSVPSTAGTATISGAIQDRTASSFAGSVGSFAKSGDGALTLSGANTYTGTTDVRAGTLQLTGSLSSSTTLNLGNGANSGSLVLGGSTGAVSQTVANLTTAGTGTTNAVVGGNASISTLTVNSSTSGTFAGTLGGAGANQNNLALTKSGAGTLTLSGANTYTGATTIGAGATLQIGSGATAGSISASSAITTNGTLAFNRSDTLTQGTHFASAIIGTGGISQVGSGTIILNGTNSYGGATTVSAGTLQLGSSTAIPTTTALTVSGTFDMHGQLIGSPRTVASLAGNGTLKFGIDAGGGADALAVTAINSANGLISISALASSLTPGDYNLITDSAGGLGTFALTSLSLPTTSGLAYALSLTKSTSNVEVLTIGPGVLGTAYWAGSHDGAWNTVSGGTTNFSADAAGTSPTTQLPQSVTDVYFTATTAGNLNTTLGADTAINSLTFTANATSSVAIGGANTLTISAGLGAYPIGTGIVVAAGSGTHTISANVALGANQSWTNNSTSVLTVSGNISGAGKALTLGGTGTITLSGNNTYSGGTTLTGGTLNLGSANALPAGTFTISAGTIDNTTGSPLALPNNPQTWGASFTVTGAVDGTHDINMGTGDVTLTASPTVTVGAGTLTVGGAIGGAFGLTKAGAGKLVLNGANAYTGATNVNQGEVDITGGTTGTTGGRINIALNSGNTATLRISGAGTVVNAQQILLAGTDTSLDGSGVTTANVIQTGGIVTASQYVVLGSGASSGIGSPTGTWSISGGELRLSGTGTRLEIATGIGAMGTLNVSGTGAVKLYNNQNIVLGTANGAYDGTITQSGGTVTFYSDAGTTVGGTGALILGLTPTPGVSGAYDTPNYTYNLDGGTLTVPQIQRTAPSGTTYPRAIFSFNGGVLAAARSNTTWMQGLDHAYVKSGGAIIDSNGFDVTMSQNLEDYQTSGVTSTGGLTKQGAGSLTLTGGAPTYTGPTTVTGGTLRLGTGALLNYTSSIIVNGAGAKFVQDSSNSLGVPITIHQGSLDGTGSVGDVSVDSGAANTIANGDGTTTRLALNNLTFHGAGALALHIQGGSNYGATALSVNNTLKTEGGAGSITVDVYPSSTLVTGHVYDLVYAGSMSGSLSDYTLGNSLIPREKLASSLVMDGGNLALSYVGDNPRWMGGDNGNWIVGTTGANKNWKLPATAAATDYMNLDRVIFDDSATGTTSIAISAADVTPTSVTFNNSTQSYTLTSSGGHGIAGTTGLTKNGAGAVTILGNNTYTGATTVNGGTLTLAGTSASPSTVLNGGALRLDFSASTAPASNILAASSALTLAGGALSVIPSASAGRSQTVASTAVNDGGSAISVGGDSATNPTALNLGAVSRVAGGTVIFSLPTGTQSSSNGVLASATATNGILPWAVVSSPGTPAANTVAGYNFASIASGNVVGYTGATTLGNVDAQTYNNSPTVNFDVTDIGNFSSNYGPNANSVRFLNASAVQYDITSNGRFIANAIMAAGTGGVTIPGSGLRPGTSNELVLVAATEPITVSGIIRNQGDSTTVPSAITIMGPNRVSFTNAGNNYTGPTNVNGGVLAISGAGSIETSSGININGSGARFVYSSSVVSSRVITLGQGTLDGTGTVGNVTVGNGAGGIVSNGDGGTGTLTIGSLTFQGAASANINYGGSPGVIVSGTLTTNAANGKVTINPSGAFAAGYNNLIGYGSLSGSLSDFALGTVAGMSVRSSGSLVLNGNNIALSVTDGSIVWSGGPDGQWTTATTGDNSGTKHWATFVTHTPTNFWATDILQFNDTVDLGAGPVAPTTTTININGANVSPGLMTFNNSAVDYTISSGDGHGIATGGLTKNGTGALRINTANSYNSGTTLNAGTLNIGNAAALGTGRLTITGGTISNTTGVTVALSTNNAQTWSGSFAFAGTNDLNMGTGAVTLNANPTVTVTSGTLTVGGVIGNGTGNSLIKDGTGTLALTGRSTYTGGTVVNNGILSLGTGGGTGTIRGPLTINSGGTVRTAAGDAIGYTVGSQVATLTVNTGGTFDDYTGGNQGFSTNFVLNGGTVQSTSGGRINFDTGYGVSTTTSGVTSTFSAPVQIRGTSLTFDVASGSTLNSTGNIAGGSAGLIKNGLGTLSLGVSNSYVGGTTVNAGTLVAAGDGSLGSDATTLVSGAVLDVRADISAVALNLSGTGISSGGALITSTGTGTVGSVTLAAHSSIGGAGNLSINGAISGSGMNLTKVGAGTSTLSAVSGYTGATTVSGGTLRVSGAGNINSTSGITVDGAGAKFVASSSTAVSPTVTVTNGAVAGTGTINTVQVADLGTNSVGNGNGDGTSAGTLTVGSLTFAGAGKMVATVDPSNPTTFGIVVTNLTANGAAGSVAVGAVPKTPWLYNTDYNLASYTAPIGGTGGASAFTKGEIIGLSTRTPSTLTDTGSAFVLHVGAAGSSIYWTGAGDGNWATGLSNNNWKETVGDGNTNFLDYDHVIFDDNGSGHSAVSISGAPVKAGQITFNNTSAVAYTISGSGIAYGAIEKNNTGSVTISTNNSLTGGVTVNGGTLTLSGINAYSGGTTLTGGTLNVNNASALGSGPITISGGTLNNTSGALVPMTGNPTQAWNGDFVFTGSNSLNIGSGAVTLGGTGDRTVTVDAGTLTVGQITSASQGLTKAGGGTLAITASANSNIAGTLNVAAGTFQMNTGATAGTSADFVATGLTGSGTIVNGAGVARWLTIDNAADFTFSGSLQNGGTGALGFSKGGAGTMTLSGSNSYTDTTTVGAGTLVISGPNSGAGTNATVNAGALKLANTSALGTTSLIRLAGNAVSTLAFATDTDGTAYALTMGTGTNATITSDRATAGAGINHTLTTQTGANGLGGGTLTFTSGANVTSGTGRITFTQFGLGAGSVQTTTLNPTSANVTVGDVAKQNNNYSQSLALDGTTSDNYVTGVISNGSALSGANAVSLAKSNTSVWTLSGSSPNTYTGGTTVSGGRLVAAKAGAFGSGAVTVNGGQVQLTASQRVSDVVLAGGGLDMTNQAMTITASTVGVGAWTSGAYTGLTAQAASHAITTSITGDSNKGVGITTGADAILHGNSTFNGVAIDNSASEVLIQYGWNGDLNMSGAVDYVDYGVIDNAYLNHTAPSYASGDINLDGVINYLDYGMMDNAYLAQGAPHSAAASAALSSSAVPEPAALGLVAIGAVGLLTRRRRGRQVGQLRQA